MQRSNIASIRNGSQAHDFRITSVGDIGLHLSTTAPSTPRGTRFQSVNRDLDLDIKLNTVKVKPPVPGWDQSASFPDMDGPQLYIKQDEQKKKRWT